MKRSTEGRGAWWGHHPHLPGTFSLPRLYPSCAPSLKHLSHPSLQLQSPQDSSLLQEVFSDSLLPSQ